MTKTSSPKTTRVAKAASAPTASAKAPESVEAPAPAARRPRQAPAKKMAPVPRKSASAAVARKAAPAKVKAVAAAPEAAPTKPPKPHKTKLVRDSFTIPKDEYQVLDALKLRALGLEQHVRKSELLRAGIKLLAALDAKAFLAAIDAVPTLKTGRPKAA